MLMRQPWLKQYEPDVPATLSYPETNTLPRTAIGKPLRREVGAAEAGGADEPDA